MIVFSDMDGTFLTSEKKVSDLDRQALDACADAGVDFVPCTGRPLSAIPAEVLEQPAVRFAVSSNGARVSELCADDPADTDRARGLYAAPLDRERALTVWDIARRRRVTFDVFADGHCYLERRMFAWIPEFVRDPYVAASMRRTRTAVDEPGDETIRRVGAVDRIAMYWGKEADRDAILAELADVPGIEVTSSYPVDIEVMEAGCSKGAAMRWLCGHLGVPVAEAVAFGDNFNDEAMIRAAGLGVAVANAEAQVRAAADMVCASNDESGAARVILERLRGV